MKKLFLIIIAILITVPFGVNAAKLNVKTLEVKVNGSTINYSGTMDEGSIAVICKLYDSSNATVDLLSTAVNNNSFNGSFTNVSDGSYYVSCANYEGGKIKKANIVVGTTSVNATSVDNIAKQSSSKKNTKITNPDTGDSLLIYLVILGISSGGLVFVKGKLFD